MDNFVNVIVFN